MLLELSFDTEDDEDDEDEDDEEEEDEDEEPDDDLDFDPDELFDRLRPERCCLSLASGGLFVPSRRSFENLCVFFTL